MKKFLIFTLLLSCVHLQIVFSQDISCEVPKGPSSQHIFSILQKHFSATAKQELKFREINSNPAAATISTEFKTFKLKRKTPRIGEFPALHRPKWRKEKIQLKAALKGRVLTVTLNAHAYNKRDKKWHKVHSTGRYEEAILEGVLTESLEGLHGKTMGNPIASVDNNTEKLKNLQPFMISAAYISIREMKTLVVDLTDKKGVTHKVSVPFLGAVNNICNAIHAFFSRFTTRDLKAGVPASYDFYWAYAIAGDLMDGMHENQVLT